MESGATDYNLLHSESDVLDISDQHYEETFFALNLSYVVPIFKSMSSDQFFLRCEKWDHLSDVEDQN